MAKRGAGREGKSLTISDVAAHAGVSAMTVSRVINGEAGVRDTTKDIVRAAIAHLNYAPNPAAQSLAGASQIQIGILYSNPSAAYLSEFLVGGLDQASRGGVQLVVEKCEPGDHEAEVARRLIAAGVDGLILPPPLCDSDMIQAVLAETRTLGVAVATSRAAATISAVSIDDHRAAFTMTSHIAKLGHQRIGFIMGNPNQTASAERLSGYRDALTAAGLPLVDELVVPGLFTYHSGLDAAELLLDLAEPPTAIFASNDDMAAAAVAAAHRRGLDVPGDITVCGFDDTALSTTIWPELTTIHQPISDMARGAVDILLEEIRRRRAGKVDRHRHLVLDFKMIRRQSDAAPRKRPTTRITS
jgi:LacI family transcriptional regulator